MVMPKRIPDYPDAFSKWNHLESLGPLNNSYFYISIYYFSFSTTYRDRYI